MFYVVRSDHCCIETFCDVLGPFTLPSLLTVACCDIVEQIMESDNLLLTIMLASKFHLLFNDVGRCVALKLKYILYF